eukprot:scaffold23202_cov83-Skeletonema_dohrnii-CCMP3373.AAC.5
MGHWKLLIAIFTAPDTIWFKSVAGGHPNWTSSGHLRRCSMADTQIKNLSTVDCHIHSARYDTVMKCAGGHPNWTSSGHLRRCSMADTQINNLSTVDCHIHSARYNTVMKCAQLDLIRSPTTLQRRRYADKELEQWQTYFYTIVTNVNGSLEAVECHIHSARYDMVLESKAGG